MTYKAKAVILKVRVTLLKEGGDSLTKVELINAVARKAELTKKKSTQAVEALIDSIAEALKKGEKVVITGFGTFSVSQRNARTGRNPKTGAKIEIPAVKYPKFTPGKLLREFVK